MITDQNHLHRKLIEACQNGNIDDVKQWLDAGAEPNFNIKTPINALNVAVQIDNHQIIDLLLKRGAIVKEYVLQQAIEKDKNYLHILIPNFKACRDETILMGVLQAAINLDDVKLVKQAINQGAKPESLFLFSIRDFGSTEILQLLIENGFNIHAEKNALLTEWMGTCELYDRGRERSKRDDILVFISEYYLEKPTSIKKFKSWRLTDKSRLFRMGLSNNNFNMMKFALAIGADTNEALNAALNRYYRDKSEKICYNIIEYILKLNIEFKQISILNAVCFKYTELLNALSHMPDLEYAYEIACQYEKDDLQEYFIQRGVSYEAQNFIKMKVSAIKGDVRSLRQAVNNNADVEALGTDVIVEIINQNQVESLKFLYDSGLPFDTSLNEYLNESMNQYKSYESISFLIELGLNISSIKNIPLEYKKRYPAFTDMWKKRFGNIFDYTIYLSREVYPNAEGKEKEEILKCISELSTLPYVLKRSQGQIT